MDTGNKSSWFRKHPFASSALVTAIFAAGLLLSTDAHVAIGDSSDSGPLSNVPVPTPIGGDIVDQAAAVRLGKALFWDVQVGGDGQTSCGTCHFHGGADNRTFNTLNPGPDGIFGSGGVTAAGQQFHPSNIVNDDRVTSQGLTGLVFVGIDPDPHNAADLCGPGGLTAAPFFANRRTTTRNAPTTTNGLAFFRQLFWDGRGNDIFNGVNPFGQTGNQTATPGGVIPATNAALTAVQNAALASQAVGPVNRNPEMSCAPVGARAFNGNAVNAAGFKTSLAAKMMARPALQHQFVHPQDSVLGGLSNWPGKGLKCGDHPCGYRELIAAAFGQAMADTAEAKFSRIFGQAAQAYESTLIPDRTPLDKYLAGDRKALSSSQQKGLNIFTGKGHCSKCHAGAELTDASASFAARNGLINEDGGDQGFHNIGVRPTAEDLGRGALGQGGVAFSESGSPMDSGAFKTPALRNVKFSAPYFHNGGKATLADVVDFYSRGGDFANPELAKRIQERNFKSEEKAALVDFLMNGLTDCRVEREEAPFDHPSLTVPNGPDLPATGGGHSCK